MGTVVAGKCWSSLLVGPHFIYLNVKPGNHFITELQQQAGVGPTGLIWHRAGWFEVNQHIETLRENLVPDQYFV